MPDEPLITQQAQGSYIAQATHGGTATVQVVLPPAPVQEQNRVRFLKRLRYRYDEQWEQSLEGAGLLTLGLVSKPDAVLHHTGLLFLSPQQPERPLPPGTSIAQVYEQAGQELLILGEPGAGKSTLLLDLARRLVERAEQDAAQALPVIIPLSTWAVKQQPLTDWLSEQLTQLYDVPRRLSHSWVQTDQLLLLLDGFDEVPQEARVACIKAIAAYREEHLVPIVVCSRRTEFEEIPRPQRLVMQSAVVVQPLTQEQVGAYLLQGGEAFFALRTVLHSNPVLQELVTTPLVLHILTLTYTGSKARDLPQGGSPEEQQRIIFASYIERMIERRRNRISFPLQRIIPWLIWLARQMQQHSQTVFYLEQIQPDWLSGTRMLGVYDWLAIRLPDMLMGILLSLIISVFIWTTLGTVTLYLATLITYILLGGLLGGLLSEGSTPQRPAMSSGKAGSALGPRLLQWLLIGALIGLGEGLSSLSYGLRNGLSIGLCSILLQFLLRKNNATEARFQTPPPAKGMAWQRLIRRKEVHNGLLAGLSTGLSFGLSAGLTWLIAGRSNWLIAGLSTWLVFGLIFGLSTGILSTLLIGRSTAVQPADLLVCTWRSLGKSLFSKSLASTTVRVIALIGLSTGLLFGLVGWLSAGLIGTLSAGLSTGLSFGLSAGLSFWLLLGLFEGVSGATIEDQRRMVPNRGIRRSALNGLVLGLISAVIVGLVGWLNYGLSDGLSYGLSDGLRVGLSHGLSTGLNYGLSSLSYGLSDWLSHGLNYGLSAGPIIVLSAGLLVGLHKGGLASLRHYVLRFLLWRGGAMPWHYVRFLDEAAGCILLRKVGGGYMFVHRLILDYFASLNTEAPAVKTSPPAASMASSQPSLSDADTFTC